MTFHELLAAAPTVAPSAAPTTQGAPQSELLRMLMPLVLIFFVVYFIMLRPRKEQKQREQMLGGMKKFDKVMTIGGIIGTVVDIRDDEIVLKVDDNTNTRIKFSRGAIQKVVASAESDKAGEK